MPVLIPKNVDELIGFLETHPTAHILAGGTDYMVEVNLHGKKPPTIISLRKVEELSGWSIQSHPQKITIGAAVRYRDMESGDIAKHVPALAQAARTIGSPQIRAAGTIGGNLGTCSPAGDSLPVLFALNAIVHVMGPQGLRDVEVRNFMTGVKRNSLQTSEFVHSVTLPIIGGWQGYSKVGTRNAMVISTASVCLVRDADEGIVTIALGSVGPTVIRCIEAENWLSENMSLTHGATYQENLAQEFARRVRLEAKPIDDHRSTAPYRRHAIGVLAQRLLERAFS